jgi:hypothetical protein
MLQQYSILLQGVPAMTILMPNEPVTITKSNQLKYHQANEG